MFLLCLCPSPTTWRGERKGEGTAKEGGRDVKEEKRRGKGKEGWWEGGEEEGNMAGEKSEGEGDRKVY